MYYTWLESNCKQDLRAELSGYFYPLCGVLYMHHSYNRAITWDIWEERQKRLKGFCAWFLSQRLYYLAFNNESQNPDIKRWIIFKNWVVTEIIYLKLFQEMEDKVTSPEKAEEAKLKARYPHLGQKPGGSDFLRKRLQKGVSYWASSLTGKWTQCADRPWDEYLHF